MKTYMTFTMPNKKCDKNGEYKNYLLKRLALAYPELTIDGIDTEESPFSYQYIGPNDKVVFGANYYSRADVSKYRECRYCPFYKEENYNLATQFELAMKKLDDYVKRHRDYKPLYDFKLADGTPVREYSNFIQVGYKLIPKNNYCNFYNSLSEKDKKYINNIIIVINKEFNTTLNF